MTTSQKIVLFLMRSVARLFLSWEARGRENIPPEGSLILVSNHVHLLDPILLIISSPRWVSFMAKEELFRPPILRNIVRWAKAFPISRKGTLKGKQETIRRAQDVLQQEFILGMFPEGKRSIDGKLSRGKAGPAAIAARINVPLLPTGITGIEKIHGISWLWRRPHIVIIFGKPFKLPSIEGKLTRRQMNSMTDTMMTGIASLLPPEKRGFYSERSGHDDDN